MAEKEVITEGETFLVKDFDHPEQSVPATVESVAEEGEFQKAIIRTYDGSATFQVTTLRRLGHHKYINRSGRYIFLNVTAASADALADNLTKP